MIYSITQNEADFFFSMDKYPEDEEKEYQFPVSGQKIILPFTSINKRESFLFDIYRGSINIAKATYQNRVRKSCVLRRLDIEHAPHLNPEVESVPLSLLEPYNGVEVQAPHIHLYIEGFGEKWAVPAGLFIDTNGKDVYEIMLSFFDYCNVKKLPNIKRNLLL